MNKVKQKSLVRELLVLAGTMRTLLQHGRHTAQDLKDYATGLNSDDDRTNGFAGDKAITFLNKKIEQNKTRTQYKATAGIAPQRQTSWYS